MKKEMLDQRIVATADEAHWVQRFGMTERFAHWWTMLMVTIALATGLALGEEAESGTLLTVHWGSVALIGVGYTFALVIGDARALLRATWSLFAFDRRDATWFRSRLRHPFGGNHGDHGMFNPGQKALAWALTATMAAVILTGIQSLSAKGEDAAGPHAAAVIAAMVLVGFHVFMAALNPATSHALAGMTRGKVRRSWAAVHHGRWLDDQER